MLMHMISFLRFLRYLPSRTLRPGGPSWAKISSTLAAALFIVHLSVVVPLSRCFSCGSSCPMHRLLQIVSGLGSPEEGSACKMAHHQDQRENPTKTCHLSLSCRDGKEMAVSLEDDHFLSEPAWNLAFPRSYLLIQTDLRLFVSEFNLFPLISPG